MSFFRVLGLKRRSAALDQRLPNILNTAEFELSAAETMVLQQRTELPSISPKSNFPALNFAQNRSRFRTIWKTLYRKSLVALLTMLFSIGLIWTYFTLTPTGPANAAWKSSKKAVQAAVVPAKPQLEEARLVVAAKEEAPAKSFGFDTERHAGETQIDTAHHSMSYIKAPRKEALNDSFVSDGKVKATSTKELKLHPVLNSDARYAASKGSLEWQAGWQANNPAANAERGTKYIEYLKQNGAEQNANSLRTFGAKGSKSSAALNVEPKLERSVQSYSK